MILSSKRITKALISLRRWAGWSAPLLFANPRRQVLSRRGPYGGEWEDQLLSAVKTSSDSTQINDEDSMIIGLTLMQLCLTIQTGVLEEKTAL